MHRKIWFGLTAAVLVLTAASDATGFGRRRGCYTPCYPPAPCYMPALNYYLPSCHVPCGPYYSYPPHVPFYPGPEQPGAKPGPQTRPPMSTEARVHCLCIFDTADKKMGKAFTAESTRVPGFLKESLPEELLADGKIHMLTGDEVTREKILAACGNLSVGGNDTVLVYICTHGAIDKETGQHYLQLSTTENVPRKDIVESLKLARESARLVVLLTDACSNFGDIKAHKPKHAEPVMGRDLLKVSVLRYLLMTTRGFANITAASPGQFAWYAIPGYDVPPGGIFTTSFFTVCSQPVQPGQDISWKGVLEEVKKTTNDLYQTFKKGYLPVLLASSVGSDAIDYFRVQKEQIPHAFDLPADDPTSAAPAGARDTTRTAGSVPAVSVPAVSAPATLVITAPEQARVIVDGKATASKGAMRTYQTPVIAPGYLFEYELEVSVREGGIVRSERKTVQLHAGQTLRLTYDFSEPTRIAVRGE